MPEGMPRLKAVGQSILEIPSDEEVERILAAASERHRVSFALMAYAGLRPNEVRALRWRDVRLRREGEVVGGFVSVREGRSHGETHTPKTGQREVPVAPELGRLLAGIERAGGAGREEFVALNERKSSPTTVWTTIRAHGRRHVRGTRMLAAPACARRVRRSRTIT
ncbi:tyrosine-type recombinase/integrase, partial [Polyangium sp. 15x6]|uniref:tyrosine-type recombinase/integrase n=1 Tax=Polyangium sp. 15x6 TaxID=3042687 RepID=UPI00249A9E3D